MKQLISIAAISLMFLVGCQENPITQPYSENSNNSNGTLLKSDEPNWIGLPVTDGVFRANGGNISSVSKTIKGRAGGDLSIRKEYPGGLFGKIKIEAKIKFAKNAFEGEKLVTMSVQQSFGSTTFLPHSNFNYPVEYDLKYEGLDLNGLTPSQVDFVYLNEDGTYEQVVYDEITMDLSRGKIEIKNAQLPHFSRYGFVRKNS